MPCPDSWAALGSNHYQRHDLTWALLAQQCGTSLSCRGAALLLWTGTSSKPALQPPPQGLGAVRVSLKEVYITHTALSGAVCNQGW